MHQQLEAVTICHREDIDLLLLQLKTFEQFLEKTNVHIVVNEDKTSKWTRKVKKSIEKIKTKHNITVRSREDVLPYCPTGYGYISQQLIKLLMPFDEYIVFDAKDLLIKPVSISDFKKLQKPFSDYQTHYDYKFWGKFYEELVKKFQIKFQPRSIITPRYIKKQVMEIILSKFKDKNEFIDWFVSFESPSEFMLYDLFERTHFKDSELEIYKISDVVTTWDNQSLRSAIEANKIRDHTKVVKIHRRSYNTKEGRIMARKLLNPYIDIGDNDVLA